MLIEKSISISLITKLMRISPSQKFQRTNKIFMSPTNERFNQQRKTFNSPGRGRFITTYGSQNGSPYIRNNIENSQKSEDGHPVHHKIKTLQKEFLNEKQKRQTEYNQLMKMIRNLSINQKRSVGFGHEQLQFPMTPRIKSKDRGIATDRDTQKHKSYNFTSFTPVYEVEKETKDQKVPHKPDSANLILEKNAGSNIEALLIKMHNHTQNNFNNIQKLQQEILNLKSSIAKTNQLFQAKSKFSDVPIDLHKYIKDECRLVKTQLQLSKNDRLEQKFQLFKSQVLSQIRQLQRKYEKKIFITKEDLTEQIQHTNKRCDEIINKEKKRIDQIQEENKIIFDEFEKTIQNINEKLTKSNKIHQFQKQRVQVIELFKKQKEKLIHQINHEVKINMNESQSTIYKDIKTVFYRLEKLQDSTSIKKPPMLLKQNSLNMHKSTQENSPNNSPNTNSQVIQHDFSFQCSNSYAKHESSQNLPNGSKLTASCPELGQMMQIVTQNYNYLEQRNNAIQQSMSQVVWVLNGLLQKVKCIS